MSDEKKPSERFSLIAAGLTLAKDTVEFWGPALAGIAARLLKAPWYIVIAAAALALLLIVLFSRRLRHALAARLLGFAHNLLPPQNDLECRDKVAEYTYRDREILDFQLTYKVKFNSGSRQIPDRLKWSAGEVDRISSVDPNQEIVPISSTEKDDVLFQLGYQDFNIKLHRLYTRHDRPLLTGYLCEGLHDPDHKAMTCLVIGVYQKTNRVTLRVRFAASLKVVNVRKLKYARYLDTEPYDSQPAEPKLDREEKFRVVEFVIRHPIPGGKYAIDWEFQSPY